MDLLFLKELMIAWFYSAKITIIFYFYDCITQQYNTNILCTKDYNYFYIKKKNWTDDTPPNCGKT